MSPWRRLCFESELFSLAASADLLLLFDSRPDAVRSWLLRLTSRHLGARTERRCFISKFSFLIFNSHTERNIVSAEDYRRHTHTRCDMISVRAVGKRNLWSCQTACPNISGSQVQTLNTILCGVGTFFRLFWLADIRSDMADLYCCRIQWTKWHMRSSVFPLWLLSYCWSLVWLVIVLPLKDYLVTSHQLTVKTTTPMIPSFLHLLFITAECACVCVVCVYLKTKCHFLIHLSHFTSGLPSACWAEVSHILVWCGAVDFFSSAQIRLSRG